MVWSLNRIVSPVSRVADSMRAAVLTASPITVKSSRPPPPTLPAITVPESMPMPISRSPWKRLARRARDRERRIEGQVRVVGLGRGRAEHGEQPVADELVDVAVALGDDRHHELEQAVERLEHLAGLELLGEAREVPDVDEHHRHVDLARPQRRALAQDVLGDVAVEVGAERALEVLLGALALGHVARDQRDLAAVPDRGGRQREVDHAAVLARPRRLVVLRALRGRDARAGSP